MQRTVPVLAVAALLLFASTVAAVPSVQRADVVPGHPNADDRTLQAADHGVTRGLHLDDAGASNVTTTGTDTSSLLDVQASGLRGQFEVYQLQERMASLDSRDAQRDLLRRTFANVSRRTGELKASEREARMAYVDGETTATEFVTALARVSAKAGDVEATLTYIRQNLGDTFPELVREELRPLRPELAALQGPVRAHAVAVLRGDVPSNRLYVAASENGSTLSMIQGRTLVSQTTRWDNFHPAVHPVGNARAEINAAMNATHPALDFSSSGITPAYGPAGPNRELFEVTANFEYGRATGYFDGSTGSLFYERQELFLDSLPGNTTEQRLVDDRVVTVNRTYPGGPLQVSLTNRTGAPLDGTVMINGEEVGLTGFDGTLWTLGRAGTYEVTVVHEGQRVELTVAAVSADDRPPSEG